MYVHALVKEHARSCVRRVAPVRLCVTVCINLGLCARAKRDSGDNVVYCVKGGANHA